MTNGEIRAWYQQRVAEIAKLNKEWISNGASLEQRARAAWHIRHDARIEARSMMENAAEVADLRERDLLLYGNSDGPTFEQLVQENIERGFQLDEAYRRIISGALTTNPEVNRLFEAKEPPP